MPGERAEFERLRADIRTGGLRGASFRALVDRHVGDEAGRDPLQDANGHDSLDTFIDELLLPAPPPGQTRARESGMVHYQHTPARIIFELVERAPLSAAGVFYDLGSGLGHVPMLVNLLSGARARGVEVEPAYADYARARAADLNLGHVDFRTADARYADYADGTDFFMYTPFEGRMLQDVLQRPEAESRSRRIRLFTYGPCTSLAAQERWLEPIGEGAAHIYELGMFGS
jgi:SAM-dependent methyltransferase